MRSMAGRGGTLGLYIKEVRMPLGLLSKIVKLSLGFRRRTRRLIETASLPLLEMVIFGILIRST